MQHLRNYITCKFCNKKIRDKNYPNHIKICEKITKEKLIKVYNSQKKSKKENLQKKIKIEVRRARIDLERELNSKTYFVIWDDIYFEEDKVKFSPNRLDAILHSVDFKGIIPELNIIKVQYFKRLFDSEVYKLKFYKSNLLILKSPDWERIKNKIEIGKQYFEFITTKRNKIGPLFSIEEALKLNDSTFKKSHYLKYLASIQFKEFKLIPIIEVNLNQSENSFIFRVTSKGKKIIFIWENANENRATHVFTSSEKSHENNLKILESFICTQMQSKRSLLYMKDIENLKMQKELGYLTSIRHEDIDSYKRHIKTLIRNE